VLPWCAWIRALDLPLFDLEVLVLRRLAPVDDVPEVVVVGIDEQTLEAFPEPIALWHDHIGQLFCALAEARPTVVGLDVNLPDRSYDFLLPGVDRRLLSGILTLRRVAPLVLGMTVDASGKPRSIYPPFVSVAGPDSTGYVLWELDSDRVVRRFSEALAEDGSRVPTLVGQMARKLGCEVGSGLIDFTRGAAFSYVPLHQVVAWYEAGDIRRLRKEFEGHPVLVGSVLPFVDRHFLAVDLAGWDEHDRYSPGVLSHAQALRSILGHGLIQTIPTSLVMVLSLAATSLWWLSRRPLTAAGVLAVEITGLGALACWLLRVGYWLPVSSLVLSSTLAVVCRGVVELVRQALERRRLRGAFAGYVSPAVLDEILGGRLHPGLGGGRRRVCVLFSDIRGFTTISEKRAPEEVIALLNRYFKQWTEAVQAHDGTIDKFIGDGIMAFFGAPNTSEEPEKDGLSAACDMLGRLERLNQQLAAEGRPELEIGIGLHVGEAVIGHVGSPQRHEYTAIGDVVNLASRLEGLTKEVEYRLVCSQAVVDALGEDGFVFLGDQPIRGHTPIRVHGWRDSAKE